MIFHDSSGVHKRSIWFKSDGRAVFIDPAVMIHNRTDTRIAVSLFGHESAEIGPHQHKPAYYYEESSNFVFAVSTEIENLSSPVHLPFPNEFESVASQVKLNAQRMAVAVASLDPDRGVNLEIFSTVVFQNLTSQTFTVIDRNNTEVRLPAGSSSSAFWANPIDVRFHIVDSDEVLRSQQLHCKR